MLRKISVAKLFLIGIVFATQQAFAEIPVIDIEKPNCEYQPEHEELLKLALEFNNADELDMYLQEKYGCILEMDPELMDDIISKYPYTLVITNTGSVYFEALESCGYHPQREEFTCSMSIRRQTGYAGQPAIGAGSNEWVTVCVDYGNGLEPVDTASVHVHDEAYNQSPNWYFSAVIQANEKLQAQVQKGQTLRARAILSWATPARECKYRPVWGNQADFRIRLDP